MPLPRAVLHTVAAIGQVSAQRSGSFHRIFPDGRFQDTSLYDEKIVSGYEAGFSYIVIHRLKSRNRRNLRLPPEIFSPTGRLSAYKDTPPSSSCQVLKNDECRHFRTTTDMFHRETSSFTGIHRKTRRFHRCESMKPDIGKVAATGI